MLRRYASDGFPQNVKVRLNEGEAVYGKLIGLQDFFEIKHFLQLVQIDVKGVNSFAFMTASAAERAAVQNARRNKQGGFGGKSNGTAVYRDRSRDSLSEKKFCRLPVVQGRYHRMTDLIGGDDRV